MPVKFRNDSDETWCGKEIDDGHRLGPFACLRIAGHDGECIAMLCYAAAADGVCHYCRTPIDKPHREDCKAA